MIKAYLRMKRRRPTFTPTVTPTLHYRFFLEKSIFAYPSMTNLVLQIRLWHKKNY